jgi:hypothetical protein
MPWRRRRTYRRRRAIAQTIWLVVYVTAFVIIVLFGIRELVNAY